MLNLLHARTFLAVINERGFRAAARDLSLSPSTVVEHIRQLEDDLAAPLLVRRRGVVEPTSQGAAFAPLARAMLDAAERSRAIMNRRILHVAASSNIGTYMLQSTLAAFQAGDPLAIDLWIGANSDVAERLTNGVADVALMEWWIDRPDFCQHSWRREPLVVIVAPDHPWANRSAIEPSELLSETLLGGEPGTGTNTILKREFGELADRLTVVGGLGNTEAVKRAVRAGRGVSLVIAAAVTDEIKASQLVALPLSGIELAKELKIILPSGLPEASPTSRFLNYVLENADIR